MRNPCKVNISAFPPASCVRPIHNSAPEGKGVVPNAFPSSGVVAFQAARVRFDVAPVAPRGGVFCRAGFQAQNVLPAFAIHTYRTDDVMRSQTLTIDVNHYPTIEPVHDIRFQRPISNVRRWLGPLALQNPLQRLPRAGLKSLTTHSIEMVGPPGFEPDPYPIRQCYVLLNHCK